MISLLDESSRQWAKSFGKIRPHASNPRKSSQWTVWFQSCPTDPKFRINPTIGARPKGYITAALNEDQMTEESRRERRKAQSMRILHNSREGENPTAKSAQQ